MDMDKINKNLVKALLLVVALIGGIIGVGFAGYIGLIMLGVLFGTTSSLGLDAATTGNLTALQTAIFTFFGSLISGIGLIGSLVIVGIILVVFAGLVYFGYKAYKGKGGNAY